MLLALKSHYVDENTITMGVVTQKSEQVEPK